MAANKKASPELLGMLSAKPPSSCYAEPVNFAKAGLTEYQDSFALLVHNLLSPQECAELLRGATVAHDNKWEQALVNIGGGKQQLMTDIRSCDRIMWDEFDVVDKLLARIKPHLPPNILSVKDASHITGWGPVKRKEVWQLSRLNERMRILRYGPGMYFAPHMDGVYETPDGSERSWLTVHLYLNGSPTVKADQTQLCQDEEPLQGGATRFFGFDEADKVLDINPQTGACLVFQHRGLVHSGEDVVSGTKYTMRTDIMFRKAEVGH